MSDERVCEFPLHLIITCRLSVILPPTSPHVVLDMHACMHMMHAMGAPQRSSSPDLSLIRELKN
jgi:hypothetical protein